MVPLKSSIMFLRHKKGPKEYLWFSGPVDLENYDKLHAFSMADNYLKPAEVMLMRFYATQNTRAFQDEADIYFDKDYIYSPRVPKLYFKKNGQWRLDEIHKQTLSLNPNASFLAFYRRFVTDSVFQHHSLNEEIQFVGPDPDDEFSQMEGVITPDFWEAFAPELPRDTIYNIVYGKRHNAPDEKIFVIRGISNGQEVTMTFRHQHDKWKLTKLTE